MIAASGRLDGDAPNSLRAFEPLFRGLRSAKAIKALEQIRRFARHSDVPILIEGETGTGKTLLARYLHAMSPRSRGPFEHVDIGTLDDTLASSELFGHIAGAFTDARRNRAGCFVSAKDGTIFLDEIGKASLAVQQKLLHAVEYGEVRPLGADRKVRVNARVVTASNRPLSSLVEENRFLPDLHARLEAFRVYLPPLRQRRADIPLLVQCYVASHAPGCGYGNSLPAVAPELMQALTQAPWPYNLRQLSSTVHCLLFEAEGACELTLIHCRENLQYLRGFARRDTSLALDDIERAIADADHNISLAASRLGLDRSTLYRRRARLRAHDEKGGASQ
jgi:DNA-binding NtrC family response regulator